MTEPDRERPRTGRRAAVWDAGTGAGTAFGLAELIRVLLARFRAALATEDEAGRFAPWLAVGFGTGVLLYFIAPAEPSWMAAVAAFAGLAALAFYLREHGRGVVIALALAAVAAGFAVACVRGAMIAHPVLTRATATITIAGFVEARDSSARSDRIVLLVTRTDAKAKQAIPKRVRLAFRRGAAPSVGDHVEVRARLRPLIGPVRPGGYDFAVGAYFAGLGATGYALGKSKPVDAPNAAPLSIRIYAGIEHLRRSLAARIRAAVPGDSGAVAVALVTGIRDGISQDVNEALRISGLYHVISISGLHMALIAGALFAIARGTLAIIPGLALRRPIKKWAAVLALIGVTFYLVLSGAEVATQRSYVMIAIVLVGVLFDRPALTLRTLAAALVVTLLISPEAVLNPGFQMSFAATLALVSLYERWVPVMSAPPAAGASMLGAFAARSGRWLLLGAATSLVAGLATAFYAAFHFHRLAPYGLLANVLAMPVIAFVIMPAALLGVALLPFGFDQLGWLAMGYGIDWMIWIARKVASLQDAEGRVAAFGAGAVLVATLALLALTIPATRLRLIGVPLAAAALLLAWSAPRYDVMVDAEADAIAVRGADGKLSIHTTRRDRFTVETWLAADATAPADRESLARGFACDINGCVARTADGGIVAVSIKPEALLDDCGRAAIVIARREVPARCPAAVIDRNVLAATGALALRKKADGGWVVFSARPLHADRPWYGRAAPADPAALARLQAPKAIPAKAKVTPEDLPGDIPAPEPPETSGEEPLDASDQ